MILISDFFTMLIGRAPSSAVRVLGIHCRGCSQKVQFKGNNQSGYQANMFSLKGEQAKSVESSHDGGVQGGGGGERGQCEAQPALAGGGGSFNGLLSKISQ